MSKELEAFNGICCNTNQSYPDFQKQRKIVETALKDYEQLKSRENNVLPNDEFIGDLGEHTRDEVAMKLKALEIIKEIVPIEENAFEHDIESDTYYFLDIPIAKDKYDLLKEVLL